MKKLFVLVSLIILISGCEEEKFQLSDEELKILNPFEVEDSLLIRDTYLVYLNEENYPSILQDFSGSLDSLDAKKLEEATNQKIKAISDLGGQYGLILDLDDILVGSMSGFIFKDSSGTVARKIISGLGKGDITGIENDYKFYMQNTRARMQNGPNPLPQNTRARMQAEPQWGYDDQNFTSKAVLYLGGGIVSDTIPEAKVWVIDSGIDARHQDLAGLVNLTLSESFGNTGPADEDSWGHGTSIAGLIAAIPANKNIQNDSLIGMTGVSPGAELVSLKVFGDSTDSKYSWVMRALNHVIMNGGTSGDIVNLSLGNQIKTCRQFGIFNVIQRMANLRRIYFSIAAGNAFLPSRPKHASEYLPACIDGGRIFTAASMGIDYSSNSIKFSYFSNFGNPPVDWAVPGYYIFTIYKGTNEYAVMEGTSMSAGLLSGLIHLTEGNLRNKTNVADSLGTIYQVPMK